MPPCPAGPVTVLLIEPHAAVGESLAAALDAAGGFSAVAVTDLAQALAEIARHGRFDVVLLDYQLPDAGGLESIRRLLKANGTGVALFAATVPEAVLRHALDLGLAGFVPRTMPLRTMQTVLQLIAAGDVFVPVQHLPAIARGSDDGLQLKPREQQVLLHLCDGLQNKEIARVLDLTEAVVKADVRSLCRKLGVRNRTEAALRARQEGLC